VHDTDIVIAGGGLAGSICATVLGCAGRRVTMIDPHRVYPPDFRCEKVDGTGMRLLETLGLAEAVRQSSTHDGESWVARFGRVVDKRPGDQQGIRYDTLINAIRAEIPPSVNVILAKVTQIQNSSDRQTVTLADGQHISARLVVVANGLNIGLRQRLGMQCDVLSPDHSVTAGFNIEPAARAAFAFGSLTYYAENPEAQLAYLTLFPIGRVMRANLFGYRRLEDRWYRALRHQPAETLGNALPRLASIIGDFRVADSVTIRPADLYITRGTMQPGVVLIGDAHSTSCPAAGTGVFKVLTDAERLCNVHIPEWLASPGIGEDKIRRFYEDPAKVACDTFSFTKAYDVRALSIGRGLPIAARRWTKFAGQLGRGALRGAHIRLQRAVTSP
jgi:2-polyprenyl-6-methoxyphenol hydroxylase-like FAD-dependent oxidoreductase